MRQCERPPRSLSTPGCLIGQSAEEALVGITNRQIASVLGNSENTVRNHTISIFAKLNVSDRAEAVGAALERGIVVPLELGVVLGETLRASSSGASLLS